MKLLLLPVMFGLIVFSTHAQKTKIIRGYLCEKLDASVTYDIHNQDGQFGLTTGGDAEWFVYRVYGVPMELTVPMKKANPKTDKIGTEYRITYVTDETGAFMAKTVTKTGRFKKVTACTLLAPMPSR